MKIILAVCEIDNCAAQTQSNQALTIRPPWPLISQLALAIKKYDSHTSGQHQERLVAAGLNLSASLKVWDAFKQKGHDMPRCDFQMFKEALISLKLHRFKTSGHRWQPICQ